MSEAVITAEAVEKSFGANHVLRGINLSLREGEVTALMGANGAGKSTLVKILSGVHRADGGIIRLGSERFEPGSPSEAMAAGVVTVHQSINDGVVADLDVASNLMLDRLAKHGSGFFVNTRKLRQEAGKVAASIGLEVDMGRMVSRLSLADRQLVAIARAMNHDPKVLILDEPTSSLSAAEAERLFDLIDRLRGQGVCILYISHRMSDIRRIADRIVTMRDGIITGRFERQPLDYEGAVEAMLGHGMTDVDIRAGKAGMPVLELEGLRLRETSSPIDARFCVGEVVAVTGLIGSGKSDLASVLYGLRPPAQGSMTIDGRTYAPRSVPDAKRHGVFLCARDRSTSGVVPDFDISGNITLPFLKNYSSLGFLNRVSQQTRSRGLINDLGIVCQSEQDAIGNLSGGNQQKVMVARWLSEPSRVLVLDEPFQGVDISARRDIGRKIRETSGDRATIVLVAELDEAIEIADRILVMSDHTIVGEHMAGSLDISSILAEVAGRSRPQTTVGEQWQ
ncbi:sugar ABC transporter ATP-binding protein [Amaricoccus tamworthensis]|uniref:sugar ABC transporter ATP-binding protein n=1 Tax=Amaricoccus tamworthensis TaxID=57002 RepID=UPI003C7E8E52